MSELKACPFCGEEDCLQYYQYGDVYVSCLDKHNGKNWNTRPLEDALRAERDRAIQMVERLIESGKPIAKYLEHVDYRADTFIEIVAEWQARNE